ncbi:hypothetical protein QZH41_020008 [Actinostola sp. cb2023]|nr:hypothetical protein QZH41_020008 [Actinostola sp. cb2023]
MEVDAHLALLRRKHVEFNWYGIRLLLSDPLVFPSSPGHLKALHHMLAVSVKLIKKKFYKKGCYRKYQILHRLYRESTNYLLDVLLLYSIATLHQNHGSMNVDLEVHSHHQSVPIRTK